MPAMNESLNINQINEEVKEVGSKILANLDESNNNKKGDEKVIYHFLKEYGEGDSTYVVRILTTEFASDDERDNYLGSVVTKAPVNRTYALNTGNYVPLLLQERGINMGQDFRLLIFSNQDLDKLNNIAAYTAKFNFAWANASYTFFIRFDGFDGWGLEPLGLNIKFSKKASKRLNEVTRFSANNMYCADASGFLFTRVEDLFMVQRSGVLVIAEFTTPEGDDPKFYDGINFCSRRFAKRLGFRGNRGNLRLLFKKGVIKGDVIVVDDENLDGADLVYHTDNLKDDLTTDGFVIVTVENHEPFHAAGYNIQSTLNNPAAYHAAYMKNDLDIMEAEATAIITTGDIPEWMYLREDSHDAGLNGLDPSSMANLAEDVRQNFMRWQMRGHDVQSGQNLMYMGLNGVCQVMNRNYIKHLGTYKKTFIPMTNAIRASVVTTEAMVYMGGFAMPLTETRFDKECGVVIPGKRFVETFDLHGTWDLDDTAIYRAINLYSTNEAHMDNLVSDGVIEDVDLPATAEDATLAFVVVRSPNGPGEYSIEFCNVNSDVFDVDRSKIPTLDLAKLPLGQPSLLAMVNKNGLPEDNINYGDVFSMKDSIYMIEAQAENPGIGRLANAMMCWVDVMGVSFPPEMTDVFGEMVDAVQQGFCKAQLRAVAEESKLVYAQLLDAMESNESLTIDSDLVVTRSPKEFREKVLQSQFAIKRIAAFNVLYKQAYDRLLKMTGNLTMEMRNNSDLAKEIGSMKFGMDTFRFVDGFYDQMTSMLQSVDQQYQIDDFTDTPFSKVMKQHYKSVGLKNVVDWAVETMSQKDDEHILALYKVSLPNKLAPKYVRGRYDRFFFQTGNREALFDLFCDALDRRRNK